VTNLNPIISEQQTDYGKTTTRSN